MIIIILINVMHLAEHHRLTVISIVILMVDPTTFTYEYDLLI